MRATTSPARRPSRAIACRPPRTSLRFGGEFVKKRRQALALMTTPDNGWLTSCAIRRGHLAQRRHASDVRQFRLRLPQRRFRLLAVLDVESRHIPFHDAPLIVGQRCAATQEPPIRAVRPPEAGLDLERFGPGQRRLPGAPHAVEVVGMDDRGPAPAKQALPAGAELLQPAVTNASTEPSGRVLETKAGMVSMVMRSSRSSSRIRS